MSFASTCKNSCEKSGGVQTKVLRWVILVCVFIHPVAVDVCLFSCDQLHKGRGTSVQRFLEKTGVTTPSKMKRVLVRTSSKSARERQQLSDLEGHFNSIKKHMTSFLGRRVISTLTKIWKVAWIGYELLRLVNFTFFINLRR